MSDIPVRNFIIDKQYLEQFDLSGITGLWPGYPDQCKGLKIINVEIRKLKNPDQLSRFDEDKCDRVAFEVRATHVIAVFFEGKCPISEASMVMISVVDDVVYKYSDAFLSFLPISKCCNGMKVIYENESGKKFIEFDRQKVDTTG